MSHLTKTQQALRQIRGSRRLTIASIVLLPVAAIAGHAIGAYAGLIAPAFAGMVGVAIAAGAALYHMGGWIKEPCPKCGRPYMGAFATPKFNPLASRCRYCGLDLSATGDEPTNPSTGREHN
jgi:hypothetical protein